MQRSDLPLSSESPSENAMELQHMDDEVELQLKMNWLGLLWLHPLRREGNVEITSSDGTQTRKSRKTNKNKNAEQWR